MSLAAYASASASATDPSVALRERLERAGVVVPRRDTLLIDLTTAPPLDRSLDAVIGLHAERLVLASALAMSAAQAKRAVIAVCAPAAAQALRAGLLAAGLDPAGALGVACVPPRWPPSLAAGSPGPATARPGNLAEGLGLDRAWVLGLEPLDALASAALGVPRLPRCITVAGCVRTPGVVFVSRSDATGPSAETLVCAAGGPDEAAGVAWVALDGGALGGRLCGASDPVTRSLLLVLPNEHPLVARARIDVSTWLRRAASACALCRVCSDVCPATVDGRSLDPQSLITTLVHDRLGTAEIALAGACLSCGVCDVLCPADLSPHALVAAVKGRLQGATPLAQGGSASPAPGPLGPVQTLTHEWLLGRLGLVEFDRALSIMPAVLSPG